MLQGSLFQDFSALPLGPLCLRSKISILDSPNLKPASFVFCPARGISLQLLYCWHEVWYQAGFIPSQKQDFSIRVTLLMPILSHVQCEQGSSSLSRLSWGTVNRKHCTFSPDESGYWLNITVLTPRSYQSQAWIKSSKKSELQTCPPQMGGTGYVIYRKIHWAVSR